MIWVVTLLGLFFPNKNELQRMEEWGVVQSKFSDAKLQMGGGGD
jgi:hypothetical protein